MPIAALEESLRKQRPTPYVPRDVTLTNERSSATLPLSEAQLVERIAATHAATWYILGDASVGKTSLTRNLAIALLQRGWLPIWVAPKVIVAASERSNDLRILSRYAHPRGVIPSVQAWDNLVSSHAERSVLIFDSIGSYERQGVPTPHLHRLLDHVVYGAHDASVIVTSRFKDREERDLFHRSRTTVSLLPFGSRQAAAYCEARDLSVEQVAAAFGPQALSGLLSNPLLLRLACDLLSSPTQRRPPLPTTRSRARLIMAAATHTGEQWLRHQPGAHHHSANSWELPFLASAFSSARTQSGTFSQKALAQSLARMGLPRAEAEQNANDAPHFDLIADAGDDGLFRPLHPTFVGCALARVVTSAAEALTVARASDFATVVGDWVGLSRVPGTALEEVLFQARGTALVHLTIDALIANHAAIEPPLRFQAWRDIGSAFLTGRAARDPFVEALSRLPRPTLSRAVRHHLLQRLRRDSLLKADKVGFLLQRQTLTPALVADAIWQAKREHGNLERLAYPPPHQRTNRSARQAWWQAKFLADQPRRLGLKLHHRYLESLASSTEVPSRNRAMAVELLGLLFVKEAMPMLCEMAEGREDNELALAAVYALGQLALPEARECLAARAHDHNASAQVRETAIDGLGLIADPASLAVLASLAALPGSRAPETEVDSALRAAAIAALGASADPSYAPFLALIAFDPQGEVRARINALYALCRSGATGYGNEVLGLVDSATNSALRAQAIKGCGMADIAMPHSLAVRALERPDPNEVKAAAEYCMDQRIPVPFPVIENALTQATSFEVRKRLISLLAINQSPDARKLLIGGALGTKEALAGCRDDVLSALSWFEDPEVTLLHRTISRDPRTAGPARGLAIAGYCRSGSDAPEWLASELTSMSLRPPSVDDDALIEAGADQLSDTLWGARIADSLQGLLARGRVQNHLVGRIVPRLHEAYGGGVPGVARVAPEALSTLLRGGSLDDRGWHVLAECARRMLSSWLGGAPIEGEQLNLVARVLTVRRQDNNDYGRVLVDVSVAPSESIGEVCARLREAVVALGHIPPMLQKRLARLAQFARDKQDADARWGGLQADLERRRTADGSVDAQGDQTLLLVVARDRELSGVWLALEALPGLRRSAPQHDGRLWEVTWEGGGVPFRVNVILLGEKGSAFVEQKLPVALSVTDPAFTVLVGTAAAAEGRAAVNQVVVAKNILDAREHVLAHGTSIPQLRVLPVSEAYLNHARRLVADRAPVGGVPRPDVLFKDVATVGATYRDGQRSIGLLCQAHTDLVAFEQEAAAFCHIMAGIRPRDFAVVKGISDKGEPQSDEEKITIQAEASRRATAVALEIARGILTPTPSP